MSVRVFSWWLPGASGLGESQRQERRRQQQHQAEDHTEGEEGEGEGEAPQTEVQQLSLRSGSTCLRDPRQIRICGRVLARLLRCCTRLLPRPTAILPASTWWNPLNVSYHSSSTEAGWSAQIRSNCRHLAGTWDSKVGAGEADSSGNWRPLWGAFLSDAVTPATVARSRCSPTLLPYPVAWQRCEEENHLPVFQAFSLHFHLRLFKHGGVFVSSTLLSLVVSIQRGHGFASHHFTSGFWFCLPAWAVQLTSSESNGTSELWTLASLSRWFPSTDGERCFRGALLACRSTGVLVLSKLRSFSSNFLRNRLFSVVSQSIYFLLLTPCELPTATNWTNISTFSSTELENILNVAKNILRNVFVWTY